MPPADIRTTLRRSPKWERYMLSIERGNPPAPDEFSVDPRIVAFASRLSASCLNCESTDVDATKDAVSSYYHAAGLEPPRYWIHSESPVAAILTGSAYRQSNLYAEDLQRVYDSRFAELNRSVWDAICADHIGAKWVSLNTALLHIVANPLRGLEIFSGASQRRHLHGRNGRRHRDHLWPLVTNALLSACAPELTESLCNDLRSSTSIQPDGPVDWYWSGPDASLQSFLHESFHLDCIAPLAGLLAIPRFCGGWRLYANAVTFSSRPAEIVLDKEGQIHNETGPAVRFRDGWCCWAWRGIEVPRVVIERPELITAQRILREANVGIRRVMIERFGEERFLLQSGARIIHEDSYGSLYHRSLSRDEPLVMVRVADATPGPDGAHQHYFLRVPPTMRTAREAVAWALGRDESEYRSQSES